MKSKLNIAILAFFAIISLFAQKSEPVRFPKPKQEPQKEWSKQRTDLYVDRILKYNNSHQDVFRKKVEDSEKIEKEKQRIAQQKIDDAKQIPDTSAFGKQYGLFVGESNESIKAKIKAKNQIDGMAQLSNDIESADLVVQGSVYEIIEFPKFENGWKHKLKLRIYTILKGEQKYKIGDIIVDCYNSGHRTGNKFLLNNLFFYIIKENKILQSVYGNGEYGNSYRLENHCTFSDRDSLMRFLSNFKNIKTENEIGIEFIDYGVNYIEYNILKNKKITFEEYILDEKKKILSKKKLQSRLRNARTEGTSNNLFTITDFYPKKIRGGVGEIPSIICFGFRPITIKVI